MWDQKYLFANGKTYGNVRKYESGGEILSHKNREYKVNNNLGQIVISSNSHSKINAQLNKIEKKYKLV